MQPSRMNTITVPLVLSPSLAPGPDDPSVSIGAVTNPAVIVYAAKSWTRVLVRNISLGGFVWLAYDTQDISQLPVNNAFQLAAGMSETFVLAPGQGLFVVSPSLNVQISYAVSAAVPVEITS